MYRTGPVVGLPPFTASFIWINIAGPDSPDGTKGRWMVQGWYGPEPVPTALRTHAGLPVQVGTTRLQREGNQLHAVLTSEGADLIDATITVKDEAPAKASGVVNYAVWGQNITTNDSVPQDGIVFNRVPYVGEATPATPVALTLRLRGSDPARVLQPKRLLGASYLRSSGAVLGVVQKAP